ncbi:MAG: YebC/PmpR family DNA-binding transcriptional regulator [Chloroflexi bacterium]|nr:YebC/PmpR family DNA-binding transcriptional regulator [Chloroflexota bacterium]
MSGHSKWSTIKRAKGAADAKRGQLFTKLTREIIVAAREGGVNPEANVRLRLAIQKARDNNMPTDNIERTLKKVSGAADGSVAMASLTYEGYGPGGVAILVQALTDNRNRTSSELRSIFTRGNGNMSEAGSVAWQFESKGVITIDATPEKAEEIALIAIDAGADDFKVESGSIEIYSTPDKLENVRKALEARGVRVASSELAMVPNTLISLDVDTALTALRLLDKLEEHDDVQKVYTNADFPETALERYKASAA